MDGLLQVNSMGPSHLNDRQREPLGTIRSLSLSRLISLSRLSLVSVVCLVSLICPFCLSSLSFLSLLMSPLSPLSACLCLTLVPLSAATIHARGARRAGGGRDLWG